MSKKMSTILKGRSCPIFHPIIPRFFVTLKGGGTLHGSDVGLMGPPLPPSSPELINALNVKILFYDTKRTFSFSQCTHTGPKLPTTRSLPILSCGIPSPFQNYLDHGLLCSETMNEVDLLYFTYKNPIDSNKSEEIEV
jgi:hypothetical protein